MELGDELVRRVDVFVGRDRRQEVARVGQAVRADRAEVGQAEGGAEVLADVAARRCRRGSSTRKRTPRGMTTISCGSASIDAELGDEALPAELRHDQHLAVGVVEGAPLHRAVGGVDVRRRAGLRLRRRRCRPSSPGRRRSRSAPSASAAGSSAAGSAASATSSKALTMRPASSGSNGRCIADGRMRYSHERRLSARGAVKAVPLSCSA